MGMKERIGAVRAAEAEADEQRRALEVHLVNAKAAGESLLTPGRIVLAGLAIGVLTDRLLLQPRERQPAAEAFDRPPTDAGGGLMPNLVSLISAATPLLMPLIARWSAQQAADEAADETAAEMQQQPPIAAAEGRPH